MSPLIFDSAALFILIVAAILIYNHKFPYSQKYELTILLTIAIYRLSTYTFLALGGNFGTHSVNVYAFDHKFIGAILVLASLIFIRKSKFKNLKAVILGLGTGMVIDEISEVFQVLGLAVPASFRDSPGDLTLIAATFGVFIAVRRLLVKPVR